MGGLPIDLILFAMVAAFLVLRLRRVLGRRTGFERQAQPEAAPVPARGPATEVEIGAKPRRTSCENPIRQLLCRVRV